MNKALKKIAPRWWGYFKISIFKMVEIVNNLFDHITNYYTLSRNHVKKVL